MTISRGIWVKQNGAVGNNPVEARRALGSQYFESSPGVVRTGLHSTTPDFLLVTGTSGLNYSVAAFPAFVIGRAANEGCYVMTAQGDTVTGDVAAAPSAGLSRWDLIYLKQNDLDKGEADNMPVLGVVQGAAAASPTKPTVSVPAGATVIAEARIYAGTTGTDQAPNVITQNWRYTALKGQPVPVRDVTERAEILAPEANTRVARFDLPGYPEDLWTGAAWASNGFFPVNTSDTNWTYRGGLWVDSRSGQTKVEMNLVLTRGAAAGNIALTTAETASFIGLIPGTYCPSYGMQDDAVLYASNGSVKWGLVVRFAPNGDAFLRTDTGAATIVALDQIPISISWVL